MIFVASSASVEVIFFNFSFIQNKPRNMLELHTVSKLMMAYKMLNSKDKNLCPEAYEDY